MIQLNVPPTFAQQPRENIYEISEHSEITFLEHVTLEHIICGQCGHERQRLPSKDGNDSKLHKRILSLARCGSGPWGRARAPLHINARGLPQTHFASEQRRTQVTGLLSFIARYRFPRAAFPDAVVLTDDDDDDDDEVFSRSSDIISSHELGQLHQQPDQERMGG